MEGALAKGAAWAVENGHGRPEDLTAIEAGGCLPNADPAQVSERARQRGAPQLGTLGSGNHFLEIQAVETIADEKAAYAFGITEPGQVMLSIHTGSRGLGHQVCQEFLGTMQRADGALRDFFARQATGLRSHQVAGRSSLPWRHGCGPPTSPLPTAKQLRSAFDERFSASSV